MFLSQSNFSVLYHLLGITCRKMHGDSVWTQMTTSYAELGETCAATTVALGIVVFFSATYAAATFRPVVSALANMGVRPSTDTTLAKFRCVVARAEKRKLYHSAGVVDTRHFAKIRVSQGDLRSKLNRHVARCVNIIFCDIEMTKFGIISAKLAKRSFYVYWAKRYSCRFGDLVAKEVVINHCLSWKAAHWKVDPFP